MPPRLPPPQQRLRLRSHDLVGRFLLGQPARETSSSLRSSLPNPARTPERHLRTSSMTKSPPGYEPATGSTPDYFPTPRLPPTQRDSAEAEPHQRDHRLPPMTNHEMNPLAEQPNVTTPKRETSNHGTEPRDKHGKKPGNQRDRCPESDYDPRPCSRPATSTTPLLTSPPSMPNAGAQPRAARNRAVGPTPWTKARQAGG